MSEPQFITVGGKVIPLTEKTGGGRRGAGEKPTRQRSARMQQAGMRASQRVETMRAKRGMKSSAEATPTPSQKAILAKQTSRLVGADVQRYSEEHCESALAAGLSVGKARAYSLRDNEPVDVIQARGGKIEHGIELKVMTDNKNSKITMKADAMQRKADWMKENAADYHTVVFDDHAVFNAKGEGAHDDAKRVIYYRRGYGSFRVTAMHRCADMTELRQLIGKPGEELPKGAAAPPGYEGYR